MFTPSMTNEEIEAVAYKDFLEIRGRVEIAKDKFVQRVRCTPPGFWGLAFLAGDTYPSNPLQEYMDCIFLLFVHDTGRCRESLIYDLHLPAGR